MTFDRRSPSEYLQEVRGGGPNRRWQAAFELSRSINRVKPGPEREALAAETLRVYAGLSRNRPEDVPVRRYLALVLGKLGDAAAVPALLASAKDPDSETRLYSIWSLGVLADPRALDAVLEASQSSDPGERKMAAYVLGRLRSAAAVPRLKVLAEDSVAGRPLERRDRAGGAGRLERPPGAAVHARPGGARADPRRGRSGRSRDGERAEGHRPAARSPGRWPSSRRSSARTRTCACGTRRERPPRRSGRAARRLRRSSSNDVERSGAVLVG